MTNEHWMQLYLQTWNEVHEPCSFYWLAQQMFFNWYFNTNYYPGYLPGYSRTMCYMWHPLKDMLDSTALP